MAHWIRSGILTQAAKSGPWRFPARRSMWAEVSALLADSPAATAWNPDANGAVSAIAVLGSTVYAGGDFKTLNGQPRNYLAALDTTTGATTAWETGAEASVISLAVSGSTVYAGGLFGYVGFVRNNIAALDAGTGASTAWNPNANGAVSAIVISDSTVYAGGKFTTIGGETRNNIAALDASTGAATAWDPDATPDARDRINPIVSALTISGGTVYAGGTFIAMGGETRNKIAALDISTGVPTDWDPDADGAGNAILAIAAANSSSDSAAPASTNRR